MDSTFESFSTDKKKASNLVTTTYQKSQTQKNHQTSQHLIHIKNLPVSTTEYNILEFFKPHQPLSVKIYCDNFGQISGEADVEFFSHHDAVKAMSENQFNSGNL